MNYLLLMVATLGVSAQDMLRKGLATRGEQPKGGVVAMNMVIAITVLVFFLAAAGFQVAVHMPTLPYAMAFALSYSLTTCFVMLAVAAGPLSVTSLAVAGSMLLPAVHGALFLSEPLTGFALAGLVLLAVALCLVCLDRNERLTPRWCGYVSVVFVCNGMCSVIQKLHQIEFDGGYKSEFMVSAMAVVAIACLVWLAVGYRQTAIAAVRHVWGYSLGVGVCNGMVNLLVMVLSLQLAGAVMYPVISGGSLLLSCLAALLLFGEPLSLWRGIGVVCGIAAVVVMNL